MSALLLIDTHVRMYKDIAAAAKSTTSVVLFDSATSSLDDIVAQVKTLPAHSFTSVGLVQDGTNIMPTYQIVRNQSPCELQNIETVGMNSWSPVSTFLQSLQSETGMVVFDFISCQLGANPGFSYAITQISSQLGVKLRASKDITGNLAEGGNWIQESDGVNIQDVYFTDVIAQYAGVLQRIPYISSNNPSIMVTDANPMYSMVSSTVPVLYMCEVNTPQAITAWGSPEDGGFGEPTTGTYTKIASNDNAFAALKSDGSIAAWGLSNFGGSLSDGAVRVITPGDGLRFTAIASTVMGAFAALKDNGSITAWGDTSYGGDDAPTDLGYTAIASTTGAFAALNSYGSITAWGDTLYGGTGEPTTGTYTAIASNTGAFAALISNGSIAAWGNSNFGGSLSDGTVRVITPGTDLTFTAITSTYGAFAALKSDGSITVWGSPFFGTIGAPTDTGFTAIDSNNKAFAALKSDGSITAWGDTFYGGSLSDGTVRVITPGTDLTFTAIASTISAFAALKSDGSITAWGDTSYGGDDAPTDLGYTAIASTTGAFAALNSYGSITAWGDTLYGSDGAPTTGTYTAIASTIGAFAALKDDGSITAWGSSRKSDGNTDGYTVAPTDDEYTAIASSGYAFAAFKTVYPCFAEGTRILTQHGYKGIETLDAEDRIVTSDLRIVPFNLFKTATLVATSKKSAPYLIQRHAFGRNLPAAPIRLSPDHKIQIGAGRWLSAKMAARNNPLVTQCDLGGPVTYYQIECENYFKDNLVAEGLVVESYGTIKATGGKKDIYMWNEELQALTRSADIAKKAVSKSA